MSKENYNDMTAAERAGEDFMSKNWRPMMAMTYMLTCLFDFIVGPILYNVLQYYNPGQHLDMWQPLTLQGGGLYHIAMGVVLGITAHGRTQEKINGVETPSLPSLSNFMPQQSAPAPAPAPFAQPAQPAFGAPVAPGFPPQPVQGFAPQPVGESKFGKLVPQPEDPIL